MPSRPAPAHACVADLDTPVDAPETSEEAISARAVQVRQAPPQRGLWMHYHDGNVYGTSAIVGDNTLEALAVSRMNSWNVGYSTTVRCKVASLFAVKAFMNR